MVEKAFDLVQTDAPEEEDLDEPTALITRALRMTKMDTMRRLGKFNNNKGNNRNSQPSGSSGSSSSSAPQDKKDIICWWCQGKGHRSIECPRKKAGKPATERDSKAMLAAWGDEGEGSDSELPATSEVCLMALNGKSDLEVKQTNSASKMSRADILAILKDLTDVNEDLRNKLEEQEVEIAGIIEENNLWANTAMELQDGIKNKKIKCANCPNLKQEIEELKRIVQQLELEKKELVGEVEQLKLNAIKKPTLKEKFRPGIGYVEEEKYLVPEKAMEKTGDQTDQKKDSDKEYTPFDGSIAYKLWKKQDENTELFSLDFEALKKRKPYRPGKSKYVNLKSQRVCWHCGASGHFRRECPKLKAAREKNQSYANKSGQQVRGNNKSKKVPSPTRSQQNVPRNKEFAPRYHKADQRNWTGSKKSTHAQPPVAKPRKTPRRKVELNADTKTKTTNKSSNVASSSSKTIKPTSIWVRKTDVSLAGKKEGSEVVHRQRVLTPHDGEQGVVPHPK